MQAAPKTGFSYLVGQLTRPSSSHVFILEGEPAECAQLASAIASHLGREIYILSKDDDWKNRIASIPASAQSHSILFFDEADALFGKRTSVNDSHDRYANLASSFAGLIFLGASKAYLLPTAFTQCAKPILVHNYLG